MKLQWAFGGNPRGKKRRKKVGKSKRKHVAKRRKASNSNNVKPKQAVKRMAKSKRRKKRNPIRSMAFKVKDGKKKLVGTGTKLSAEEIRAKINNNAEIKRLTKVLFAHKMDTEQDVTKKKHLREHIAKKKGELAKGFNDHGAAIDKYMQRLKEEGAEIKEVFVKEKSAVAKKKKSSKKKTKKSTKKKATKKASKKKAKKSVKRKASKKVHKKKRRSKAAKRKAANRRRRVKRMTHSHAKSTRHVKKGARAKFSSRKRKGSYKIKSHFGRGKKRVKVSGRARISKGVLKGFFKINPFRSNPVDLKKITGLEMREIKLLAVGAAAAPLANAALKYIPGISVVTSKIAQYVPVQYQAGVTNLLLGAVINYGSQYAPAGGAKKAAEMVGEGLAAAAVIGLVSSIVSDGLRMGGLAGVNYTPSMRGMGIMPQLNGMGDVRFTPRGVNGVNYTPNMGSNADFGSADYGGDGGYTEAHNRSRADFGANFSEDSEAEGLEDQDNSYSSSMN